ncbi:hypothetical protein B0H10DRAFT_2190402 [Mycena sp. CBHHK59/15]|nr:hypothetical protein B0H10DRAFT_2190402 [Mycena sp. CBHHK59/15]
MGQSTKAGPFRVIAQTILPLLCKMALLYGRSTNTTSLSSRPDPLDFGNSKWIWTTTTATNAVHGFRKDFMPPFGKSFIAADILIAADNSLTLFVNGDEVGSTTGTCFARRFCSRRQRLLPQMVHLLPPYSSHIKMALQTLSSRIANGMQATLPLPALNSCHLMILLGQQRLRFPSLESHGYGLTLSQPVVTPPAGQCAFRKTFVPVPGETPQSAHILITVDNTYTLFVNSIKIGSGLMWKTTQHWVVNLASAEIMIAVLATNTAISATSVLFSMNVNMASTGRTNCSAGALIHLDTTWKSTKGTIPAGFELPGFDDSVWSAVAAEATYPNRWGTIAIGAPSAPINS